MPNRKKKKIHEYENNKEDEFKYIDHYEKSSTPCMKQKITTSEYDRPWFEHWLGIEEKDDADEHE